MTNISLIDFIVVYFVLFTNISLIDFIVVYFVLFTVSWKCLISPVFKCSFVKKLRILTRAIHYCILRQCTWGPPLHSLGHRFGSSVKFKLHHMRDKQMLVLLTCALPNMAEPHGRIMTTSGLERTMQLPVIWYAMTLMWRQSDGLSLPSGDAVWVKLCCKMSFLVIWIWNCG